jgi:hypothetical protein
MESMMEKRSIVGAVYAESLVFESSFGFAEGPATGSSSEVTRRAPSISAGSVAVPALESAKPNETTKSPTRH